MNQKIWFYASILPFFVAFLGLILAYLASSQQWGGGDKISIVIAVFFCEIVMVVAAFGALSYMKQEKTSLTKRIQLMNILVAISGALSGIYLFLSS